jgi:hypothetical protein
MRVRVCVATAHAFPTRRCHNATRANKIGSGIKHTRYSAERSSERQMSSLPEMNAGAKEKPIRKRRGRQATSQNKVIDDFHVGLLPSCALAAAVGPNANNLRTSGRRRARRQQPLRLVLHPPA